MKKKIIALGLIISILFNVVACSFIDTAKSKALSVKDSVVNWYENLDFSKFEEGWNTATDFLGSQYSAMVSSEYVQDINIAISQMKIDMNATAQNARNTAQNAGYLAEQWAADTFNINAIANGSEERAWVVGSNAKNSVDVDTTYGDQASLKFYEAASSSAREQAKNLLSNYMNDYSKAVQSGQEVKSFPEYMEALGFDSETMNEMVKSAYDGQVRIIPENQMESAIAYLNGKIENCSQLGLPSENYEEALSKLRDRLKAPDGTESVPVSYEEMQEIAELCQNGEFDPAEFGISTAQLISPKYVVKLSIGTGLEIGVLNTLFTVAPDIYSVIRETAKTGELNEDDLADIGVEGAISMSEGFVEGSVSNVITTLAKSGVFGKELMNANPNVIAALTVMCIQAIINGYKLSKGEITPEDYGNLTADNFMISMLSLGTSKLLLMALPATKIAVMLGCLAGGMVACVGYTVAKEAVFEFVDGGGFEAIVPVEVASTFSVWKESISSLDIKNAISSFGDTALTTLDNGYIQVKGLFDD